MAISVNPDYEYALMKVENGEVYIVAKDLAAAVAKASGIESYEIIATVMGSQLELMTADPLGSYTGRPEDPFERPVQDADDL
jgi:isoleucyl-tRNA synthetase